MIIKGRVNIVGGGGEVVEEEVEGLMDPLL